jgi:prevent-host-death family protein
MKTMPIRQAAAHLSSLIRAAENGEPTTITRNGKPMAVLMSVEDAKRVYEQAKPSFAELLLACPGGIEFEGDRTPPREIDL